MIEELNETNFKKFINSGLKLVEFYAKWCGFCQKQRPILEELTNLIIGAVDIDENYELAAKYQISGYPTFILFKNGTEYTRFTGLHTKYDLLNKVMDFMKD